MILAYWVIFYLFVVQDRYFDNPDLGEILKTIMPVALIINIAGVVIGCIISAKERLRGIMVIAVYGVPLLAAAAFLWWLFFGVKI